MSCRWCVLSLVLWSASASAELEGTQRLVGVAGWRYTPNDTFRNSANANQYEVGAPSLGGPQGSISFGYSFTDWAELAVDAYVGSETLDFVFFPDLLSVTYGALIGVRLQTEAKLFGFDLIPSLGVFTGPSFVYVSGPPAFPPTESLGDSYMASAGATVRLSQAFGVTAEAKLLLTRGFVPGIGTLNGGGLWVGVGFCWFLGQIPKEQRGTLD